MQHALEIENVPVKLFGPTLFKERMLHAKLDIDCTYSV